MIRFEDVVQKIVIDHGVAADRLNRDLTNLLAEVYFKGFSDCDAAMAVGRAYDLLEVKRDVFKLKESFGV